MTKEALFLAFDAVDEAMVADAGAAAEKKKSPRWIRWGVAAACLCLLAWGGLTLANRHSAPLQTPGGGGIDVPGGGGGIGVPGGAWPEGVDPKTASIAVYPATEKVQDVAEAELRFLYDEEDTLSYPHLGDYLPHTLPDGYWFAIAAVYETTMKDGGTYHLLRATYSKSDPDNFDPEAPYLTDDCFDVQVLDYLPRTSKPTVFYSPETGKLPPSDASIFYLTVDSIYIGISPGTSRIDGEALMSLIHELTG